MRRRSDGASCSPCAAHLSDALVFVRRDALTEHWAAEAFEVYQPRTYFNPVDNQAMGWSIPAADRRRQRVRPGRQVVTVTGDGCFLMTAIEMSTAAPEGLPVKFFVLDDQAYHYMQRLQKSAYAARRPRSWPTSITRRSQRA